MLNLLTASTTAK